MKLNTKHLTRITKRTILFALCAILMSSCSIVRGLRTDGKNGPNIFSFEQREVDTIANGEMIFQFPVAEKKADWIDTTHFPHTAHPCEYMTYLEAFTKESSTQGLLVVHNDSIVYERYWGDFSADRMATIFSVSKSITSLMCGIAVDDGYIRSIDDPVTDYLPELKKKVPRWQRLTIRHLLDMRSGLDFDDTYDVNWKGLKNLNAMARLNYGHNIQKQIRGLKFRCEPGTQFRYESMTSAILGVVIERASGKRFADYLSERVWKPLGMEHPAVINIDSRKHDNAHTFGGISTTIHDLAKIGRLYLNNGMWNGKRIVSEEWIRQTADCDTSYHGYHFNWYNINYENYVRPENSGYYALGICEQVLYVNPYKNLVMVRIGWSNSGNTRIPLLFEQMSYWWKDEK